MQEVETELINTARELGELPVKTNGSLRRIGAAEVRRIGTRLSSEYRRQYKLAVANEDRPLYGDIFVNEFYAIEKQLKLAFDAFDGLRETRLPRLASGKWMFYPRIYALARELVRVRNGVVDVNSVTVFFTEYQQRNPLTTEEIALVPDMLRLALLEGMCRCITKGSSTDFESPDDGECARFLRSLMQSASRLGDADMNEAILALNQTDASLANDPIYKEMDLTCRAMYLNAAAKIAKLCKVPETAVAAAAVKLAKSGEGRRAHVGCYLIAEGFCELVHTLRPDKHIQSLKNGSKTAILIGVQVLLTALALIPFGYESIISVIFSVLPVSAIVSTVIISLMTTIVKPKPLPRLSLDFGVGSENRTLVCVPVLITSSESVEGAVLNLETHYLAGRLDNTEFAVLGDFPDSPTEEKDGDTQLLSLAERRIAELNKKYPCEEGDRFHYLHRKRIFNPKDGLYMGRERKRGAIEALIAYLLNNDSSEFISNAPTLSRDFQYLTVLDADTVMPAGALKKLIGTAAHPLNRPVYDGGSRPIYGYTVIAPRMASTSRSAAASRFASLVSGEPGMNTYSMSVSDFYQDVFNEGCFGGKGIIDIHAFARALNGAIPDNTVLSHDMLEGCLSRAAFANDVVLYDGEPSTYAAWYKRRHRWLRGDFQLIPFMFGSLGRNLDALSKYKIFDNLRRGVCNIAILLALSVGIVFGLPMLAAGSLIAFFIDPIIGLINLMVRAIFDRVTIKPLVMLVRRRLAEISTLPYAAYRDADAIIRSCYRMAVSHKHMLEWQTAAASVGKSMNAGAYVRLLLPCIIGGGLSIAVAILSFWGILWGLPMLALLLAAAWLLAPCVTMRLDKKPKQYRFTDAERKDLMQLFCCTWQYFEENCTESTFYLPPDNYQEQPDKGIAPLTSPTNIGMGLMAVVSAYDMGFIDGEGMLLRLERMVSTIERLEKWHGHLFNWYSLKDLSLLKPRFISSVDSGNLFASLIATSVALSELKKALNEEDCMAQRANELADRCVHLAENMNFTVLYDRRKKLFRIGCEFDEGRLTGSAYDLYASEARLMSFAVISQGQIGAEHWFSLSRLMSDTHGGRVLKSWSGTMFEYLMPLIFMETIPNSMQYEACRNAVLTQVLSTDGSRPWGVSESGYYAFDGDLHYQYRAFGSPELGLAPCHERSEVVAPYATVLSLMIEPKLAAENLRRLKKLGALGKYGMYEALDYTSSRVGDKHFEIVRSFMAHHQGMSLCAINNALNDNILVKRFMSLPGVRANEQLLFENMPANPIKISTYDSSIFREQKGISGFDEYLRTLNAANLADGQLLSNGRYSVFIGADGQSFSKRGNLMLTRWRKAAGGEQGIYFVVRNNGHTRYVNCCSDGGTAVAEPHKVTFDSRRDEIRTRLEIIVSADFECEIRTLTLINCGHDVENVSVGIFSEIALADMNEDEAHPAFVRLGIESFEQDGAILFRSRAKPDRAEKFGFLCAVAADPVSYCTDGLVLPGRRTNYAEAMESHPTDLPTTQPVEPYFSARTSLRLAPGESQRVILIAGIASSRDEALSIIHEQRLRLNGAEELSRAQAQGMLRAHGMNPEITSDAERLAAAVITDTPIKPNVDFGSIRLHGIGELWRLGISGDRAIILISVSEQAQLAKLRKAVDILLYLHGKGTEFDLVVIGEYPHEYANPLRLGIEEMLRDVPNTILLHSFEISNEDMEFLRGNALIILDSDEQRMFMNSSSSEAKGSDTLKAAKTLPIPHRKLFDFNGIGGFDFENEEYVIYPRADRKTPLPWSNVLANKGFGTLVTESGGGYTWRRNSRLNRVTPWSNDAVRDGKKERIRMIDPERGELLSLTPEGEGEYEVRHGYGYSIFTCTTENADYSLTECVDPDLPIKYYRVLVKNKGVFNLKRRVEFQVEWILGASVRRESLLTHVGSDRVLAVNLLSDFSEAGFIALKSGAEPILCTDNSIVVEFEVDGGTTAEIVLLLGCDAVERIAEDIESCSFEKAMHGNAKLNSQRLNMLTVNTEDERFNAIVNGRLLYQVYSSRLIGRTGFYQSGGAFGFRDQLQDVLSLLLTDPDRTREQILYCASMQFEAGDVLHWWHEGESSGDVVRGVRTRITDDRLFLPYAAVEYAETSGDYGVFDEICPYLEEMPMEEGKRDLYANMHHGNSSDTLYEHCKRAIDCSLTKGAHGLPLMGTGDWNDGMDCVGENGGESVFLGFFTLIVIEKFLPICRLRGDTEVSQRYESFAERLRSDLEKHAWDGTRYVRAFHADGTSLGGADSGECALDCVSECFAVFANADHKEEAFDTLLAGLVDNENGLIKLLTPAFSGHSGHRVGYIEGYLEGVRENGGQYTHAAAWSVIAACMLGRVQTAHYLFKLINPVEHGGTLNVERYKGEPYAVAGDVYSEGRLAGRAGWTLYTGAAGWLYRAATEYILGIKKRGDRLKIKPCTTMNGFSAEYRFGSNSRTLYRINAKRVGRSDILLDGGKSEDDCSVPLIDDENVHNVEVMYE
ncbi:MAG: hypothetical protein J1E60_01745 [Christensenellaceae bacterium]|nr:hypothetical protein [Christensenellaceae bacterium]